ncbi:hypothetical protein [Winogradskyella algicola]|uniref:hypothetical protein n=1 Tax=Winogradskyella algicola TaxID=2575815 RepID=UPI001108AD8A|nr:hypothetical protein [Winogradskyella algicola]
MKYYIILLLSTFSLISFAQEVKQGEKTYEVKKEKIFLNGEDVTATLSVEEKEVIFKEAAIISEKLKQEENAQKTAEKLEKEKKKAEKAQKKAEKAQKKAEKALKKKEKLQKNYKKAQDNLKKAQKKYEKLKKKGKLSPVDESKWLDKIEKLTEKVKKAKSKM